MCLVSTYNQFSYKFLILYIYHTVRRHLRDQGCEDPWLFFRSQRGSASKNFWATLIQMTDGIQIRNPRIRKYFRSRRISLGLPSSFGPRLSSSPRISRVFQQFPVKSTCPPSFSFETKTIPRAKTFRKY